MSWITPEVSWSDGRGWERRDYATIMSGRVVRYTRGYDRPGESEVSASRDAVCFSGSMGISTEGAKTALLDIIERAWRQHLHLAKRHANDPLPEVDAQSANAGETQPVETSVESANNKEE